MYYSLQDEGSGLAIYRAVIEDDDERYQKLVWVDGLSGNKFADQILWDGKFKDGTQAGTGDYMITLKISDAAGNERMQTTLVHVKPLSFLQTIPTFTVPASNPVADDANPSESLAPANPQTPVTFGGEANAVLFDENLTVNSFGVESTTTPSADIPIDPNILWGTAAAAVLGMTLAEWARIREEERQRREREEQKAENQRRRLAQLEAQQQAARLAAQDNRNDYMEDKMNAIDVADEAEYNRVQSVLVEQTVGVALQVGSNDYVASAENKPNWRKIFTGIAIIVVVDLLIVIPTIIGLTAFAPEVEISMILTEAWSWPLVTIVVATNIYAWNLITEGVKGK